MTNYADYSELANRAPAVSLWGWIVVAQAWWQTVRALARVVLKLVAKMYRIGGIFLTFGVRVRKKCVARERLDGERVSGVKVEIFFKTIRVKEIIAHPSGRKSGQAARIEVKLYAFA